MKSISVCMIVKNEEAILEETLESVKEIADEIVIVDTGSTDRTKEIAKKYTDRIFDFNWIDDFSAARNAAYSYATKDFIMFMDADDLVPETEQKKLMELKKTLDDSIDAVTIYTVMSLDQFGNPLFKFRKHRIVKRSNNFKWIGAIHEYLAVGGNIFHTDIHVHHLPRAGKELKSKKDRNLNIYKKRLKAGEVFTPRDVFYFGNELREHGEYEKAIEQYHTFLNTKLGWIEDIIRACINLSICYRSLGDSEKEMESLVRSLNYDTPRPEVACHIGDLYIEKNMYDHAITWHRIAILANTKESLGFQLPQYSTWYPHLQLTMCYWKIGNIDLSYTHHLKAKEFLPNDQRILYNDQLFTQHFKNQENE